jgi:hypothetical protein
MCTATARTATRRPVSNRYNFNGRDFWPVIAPDGPLGRAMSGPGVARWCINAGDLPDVSKCFCGLKHPRRRRLVSLHGVVFDILVGSGRRGGRAVARGSGPPAPTARLRQGCGVAAFAHFARRGHGLACPAVAREASEGWWAGRTRTCNQTVMSGGIKDAMVDFVAFSLGIDRVHYVLKRSFLVRNWCGSSGNPNLDLGVFTATGRLDVPS